MHVVALGERSRENALSGRAGATSAATAPRATVGIREVAVLSVIGRDETRPVAGMLNRENEVLDVHVSRFRSYDGAGCAEIDGHVQDARDTFQGASDVADAGVTRHA